MPAGIKDMPDRLSVLARRMRAVLCIKAKSAPLRSETDQAEKIGHAQHRAVLLSTADVSSDGCHRRDVSIPNLSTLATSDRARGRLAHMIAGP